MTEPTRLSELTYRDCQKYVAIPERIFVTNPYAAGPLSEHYYDKRYNL